MKKYCGIYGIENTFNGKVYIGSSVDILSRWRYHLYALRGNRHQRTKQGKTSHLQAAWNKYGEKNFRFYVLEVCSIEDLINHEQAWIDLLKATERYNISPSSSSPLGTKHTQESRKRMSEAKKGHKQSLETIKKRADALRGRSRIISEEWRKNISKGKKDKPFTEEHKKKISEAIKLYRSRIKE